MTMEQFLQLHFNCKRPYRKQPVKVENVDNGTEYEYLTESGMKAYERFIGMLYDLADLCDELEITGFIVPDKVESAVDDFDEFVSTEHY